MSTTTVSRLSHDADASVDLGAQLAAQAIELGRLPRFRHERFGP